MEKQIAIKTKGKYSHNKNISKYLILKLRNYGTTKNNNNNWEIITHYKYLPMPFPKTKK